jgi:hypothetical protein
MTLADIGTHMVIIDLHFIAREMAHLSAMAKIDKSQIHQKEKALRDNYTKARARQYQQIRTTKRTRHK